MALRISEVAFGTQAVVGVSETENAKNRSERE